jgi:hypothetical protein
LTEDTRETALHQFFQERIVPAAERLRERGISFFALAPDRAAQSYWVTRPRGQGYIFQVGEDLSGELHEMWRSHPELQALADDLASMSRTMAQRSEQTSDVSAFIYAMF